jgi:hypothetical protein
MRGSLIPHFSVLVCVVGVVMVMVVVVVDVRNLIPGRVGDFCPQRPDRLSGHPISCLTITRGSFPGRKRPEREPYHSPPSNAEAKHAWPC